jgi:phosphate acetyltransferase
MSDQKASSNQHIFQTFLARCKELPPLPVAVAWPMSDVALQGADEAAKAGIIKPILVGDEKLIKETAAKYKVNIDGYQIVHADNDLKAAKAAVALCFNGEAGALMKGSLHTDDLMRAAFAKEGGLRTNKRVSHVFVVDSPNYERTLFVTDAVINILPELEDKFHILQNAIDFVRRIGIEKPNVAIMSAVETVNPKIPSTIDAAILCKMADRGQITGAVVDGPLAFDTAISPRAAEIKKFTSPVNGKVDIILVPDLHSGNMVAKQAEYLGNAHLAGLVLGMKVPVMLTSRADSAESRMMSCAVAALDYYAQKKK